MQSSSRLEKTFLVAIGVVANGFLQEHEKVTGKKVTGKLWREKVVGNSGKCAMRANAGGSCFFGRFVFVGRFTVVVPARKRGQNAGGSYFKNSWNSRKSGSTKSGKSVAGCCFLSCFVFCVCVFFLDLLEKVAPLHKAGYDGDEIDVCAGGPHGVEQSV